MSKQFTSVITVEFAYNNRVANSKEEYNCSTVLRATDIELEERNYTNEKND